MIRRTVLLIGLALIGVAAVLGLFDATRSLAAASLELTPLGETWYRTSPYSLNLCQAIIQRYLLPEIWDPGIQTILQWPSTAVIGISGFMLLFLGRKKRPSTVRA
ncbi:hypothetical protein [Coralliovum pocilloporae]|uniref:hypothetical protein n=1 Tax=Coralliovum pocilloporae TaxID=3066369 RepID=UPI003307B6A1